MRKIIFVATLDTQILLLSENREARVIRGNQSYEERREVINAFRDGFADTIIAQIHAGATGWYAPKDTVILFHAECIGLDPALLLQASHRVNQS